MNEEWRPIAGFEGRYEVSNLGRVRSFLQIGRGNEPWRIVAMPHFLSTAPNSCGYPVVTLCGGHTISQPLCVHSLVMGAFGSAPPFLGACVRHLNDVKADNWIENLAWGTPKQNGEDKAKNGRAAKGEGNNKAKLTADDVMEIRRLAGIGIFHRKIALQFGISRPAISYIVRRDTWRHIP